jgi:hypothetical protein
MVPGTLPPIQGYFERQPGARVHFRNCFRVFDSIDVTSTFKHECEVLLLFQKQRPQPTYNDVRQPLARLRPESDRNILAHVSRNIGSTQGGQPLGQFICSQPLQSSQPLFFSSQPAAFSLSNLSQSEANGDRNSNKALSSQQMQDSRQDFQPVSSAPANSGSLGIPLAQETRAVTSSQLGNDFSQPSFQRPAAKAAQGLLQTLSGGPTGIQSRRGTDSKSHMDNTQAMTQILTAIESLMEKTDQVVEAHAAERALAERVGSESNVVARQLQERIQQVHRCFC